MKRGLTVVMLLLLPLMLLSCGETPTAAATDQVRIATWNLEWFGALGRSAEDINAIAEIIRELQLDMVSLQEITCECTLQELADELGYQYFISSQRVPQKLALLWNPETVNSVSFRQDAYDAMRGVAVTGMDRESRQPLVFSVVAGAFDFTLVNVHLKSIPEADRSVRIRNVQYDAMNDWLAAELSRPDAEKDVIIAGDFNSYRTGISSQRLLEAGHVVFATAGMPESEYSNIWYNRDGRRNLSFIDHIALTKNLTAEEFLSIEAIRDWDVEMGADTFENRISDHLPLVAVFSTSEDQD